MLLTPFTPCLNGIGAQAVGVFPALAVFRYDSVDYLSVAAQSLFVNCFSVPSIKVQQARGCMEVSSGMIGPWYGSRTCAACRGGIVVISRSKSPGSSAF